MLGILTFILARGIAGGSARVLAHLLPRNVILVRTCHRYGAKNICSCIWSKTELADTLARNLPLGGCCSAALSRLG